MKKIVFVLLFLTVAITMNAANVLEKVCGTYYYYDFTSGITCHIYLFDNNTFQIDIADAASDDDIFVTTISFGSYQISNKNKIILTDKISACKMKGYIKENTLRLEDTFNFLNNKSAKFHSEADMIYRFENNNDTSCLNPHILSQKIRLFKDANQKPLPFRYGIYENRNSRYETGLDYRLTVEKDGRFELFLFKKYKISEGKWEQNGNIVSLFDKTLHYTFYLFITENGLYAWYLPGNFMNVLYFNRI
ncbi:hypothetical protein FACS189429_5270 [Bacteroidia bacterium]|nr:hypothetical protein FACS189429_5270 [Bacteroidia bacterium]